MFQMPSPVAGLLKSALIAITAAGLALAQAPAGHARLFVADGAGAGVSVIDPAAGKVLFSVPSATPIEFAAVSSDARSLYLANSTRNAIQMADIRTAKVSRSAEISAKPACLAISPDGRRVFVCLAGEATIDVIDTAPMQRQRSIFTSAVGPVRGLYTTPDGTRMIAAGAKGLAVINVRSEKVEFTIPVAAVTALAFESGTHHVIRRLFVLTENSKSVGVIDYAERKPASPLPIGAAPSGIGVTADFRSLWVAAGDAVQGFSLPDLKKTATVALEPGLTKLACAEDTPRCFVANPATGAVSIIDTISHRESARIKSGKSPSVLVPEPVQQEATHSFDQ